LEALLIDRSSIGQAVLFWQKRTKKPLLSWAMSVAPQTPMPQINKSLFASFSSEKEELT
jgi:hypothetical protein